MNNIIQEVGEHPISNLEHPYCCHLRKFSLLIEAPLLESDQSTQKYSLPCQNCGDKRNEGVLQCKWKNQTFAIAFKLNLQAYWKQISILGFPYIQREVLQWNSARKPYQIFEFKPSHKILICRISLSLMEPVVDLLQILNKNWTFLKQNFIAPLREKIQQKKREIEKEIQRAKRILEHTRKTRYKASAVNLSGNPNSKQIETVSGDQMTLFCRDKEVLLKYFKEKMSKQPNILHVIEEVGVQKDIQWMDHNGCHGTLEKYRVNYILNIHQSMNKGTNLFMSSQQLKPNDVQTGDSSESEAKATDQKVLNSIFIKKSAAVDSEESFLTEKLMIAYMRGDKCSSINSYYCPEAEDIDSIKYLYSDYHPKKIDSCPERASCLLKILQTLLEGIVHLRDRSLSHRDLKPDNILLSNDYVSKIIDFGSGCHQKQFRGKAEGAMMKGLSTKLFTNATYNIHYSTLEKQVKDLFTRQQFQTHPYFDIHAFGKIIEAMLENQKVHSSLGTYLWENLSFLGSVCRSRNPEDRFEPKDAYYLLSKFIRYYQL